MKKIQKNITIEIYEAYDGEQFDTKEECEQYELYSRIGEIKMFDIDFNPTDYGGCHYIMINNEEERKILQAYCDKEDMYSPWDWGNGMLDGEYGIFVHEGEWYPLSFEIENLLKTQERLLELCSLD